MGRASKLKAVKVTEPLKLDFGCGPHPREDFEGVDIMDFGQKHTVNLAQRFRLKDGTEGCVAWPWADGSVTEAHTSHFVEHMDAVQRVFFVNELYRVLVPGGKCTMITPHWASCRAYGDLTHQWPPVSEFWFYYLSKEWRKANAPHNDAYTCDFDCTWGYIPHPEVAPRNQEYQMYAFSFLKESIQDIQATLVKK